MSNEKVKDENRLIAERREKLASIREQGLAFPNAVKREHKASDLQAQFGEKTKVELAELSHIARLQAV
jgi:lysyl-tRNA synthetase class 2